MVYSLVQLNSFFYLKVLQNQALKHKVNFAKRSRTKGNTTNGNNNDNVQVHVEKIERHSAVTNRIGTNIDKRINNTFNQASWSMADQQATYSFGGCQHHKECLQDTSSKWPSLIINELTFSLLHVMVTNKKVHKKPIFLFCPILRNK